MSEDLCAAWSPGWSRLDALQPSIDEIVAELHDETISARRFLHAHPEPSGEEFETTRFLAEHLRECGLRPVVPPQGVGLTVDLDLGTPTADSPRVAVRGDIDALRLHDRKNVPWVSTRPGLAHACGHDCHATIALMTARGLHRLGKVAGTPPDVRLRFIFQPAEESAQGAHWMVESGAMEGVDAILSSHVDPMYAVGTVGIRYGVLTAHCDEVLLRVEGRGGHAARPHFTSDPISAAAQLIGLLHQNLPRAVDVRNPSVFTIGKIQAGDASNVIPDHVEMAGSLRTIDAETRSTMIQRLQDICQGVETSTGNRITLGLHNALEAVQNDPRIVAAFETVSRSMVGDSAIHLLERPSMGGEDFSVYLKQAPGAMLRLGCRGEEPEWPGLHSPFFDVDERVLDLGLSLTMRTALLLAAETTS